MKMMYIVEDILLTKHQKMYKILLSNTCSSTVLYTLKSVAAGFENSTFFKHGERLNWRASVMIQPVHIRKNLSIMFVQPVFKVFSCLLSLF